MSGFVRAWSGAQPREVASRLTTLLATLGRPKMSSRWCYLERLCPQIYGGADDGRLAAQPRYALSFTSGALLMREALIAAPLYLREHDWTKVRGSSGRTTCCSPAPSRLGNVLHGKSPNAWASTTTNLNSWSTRRPQSAGI